MIEVGSVVDYRLWYVVGNIEIIIKVWGDVGNFIMKFRVNRSNLV